MFASTMWFVIGVATTHGDVHPLGESEVPLVCRDLGVVPADADSDQRVRARLSMASCAAGARMDALTHLRSSEVSRLALELAVAPALGVLDEVTRSAAPAWRIVAEQLRGELSAAMAVRLQRAPADTDGTRVRVDRWLAHARRACANVRRLAASHPEALANPLAARAVAACARFSL